MLKKDEKQLVFGRDVAPKGGRYATGFMGLGRATKEPTSICPCCGIAKTHSQWRATCLRTRKGEKNK